ncbi:flagellar protein FlgN [Campylobacter hyointestinalis]|uniref:Flagellar protein FlgN n=1 Tax=Campylobacter hyointestinalis TaxID=198 RepID=A0A562XBR7_CAMHY|nr:flagellar export chaperone FlgN [Campylobacter hyointestinalis]TWO19572.1 flagellar protein FlgN [Campylobacter hyointestinalis]
MINRYLDESIALLNELIEITQKDIENIKNADHTQLDEHTRQKATIIKKFENTKNLLDKELIKISSEHNGTDLANILSDEIKDKLGVLRESLVLLQNKNKEYAKFVVAVKEFYDSLVKKMFGKDSDSSYVDKNMSTEQLFKLRI